jgi:hypothetical protein
MNAAGRKEQIDDEDLVFDALWSEEAVLRESTLQSVLNSGRGTKKFEPEMTSCEK